MPHVDNPPHVAPAKLPAFELKPSEKKALGKAERAIIEARERAERFRTANIRREADAELSRLTSEPNPDPAEIRRLAETLADLPREASVRREARQILKACVKATFRELAAPPLAEVLERMRLLALDLLNGENQRREDDSAALGIALDPSPATASLARLVDDLDAELGRLDNGRRHELPSTILNRYASEPLALG